MKEITIICGNCGHEQIQVQNKTERYHCKDCGKRVRYANSRVNINNSDDSKISLLLRDIESLKKINQSLRSQEDIIISAVRDSIEKLPPIKSISYIYAKRKYKEEISVLEFSDLQIGSVVGYKETGGLCKYDKNEFLKRLDKLTKSIYEVVDIQRNGGIPLKKLKIHCLGDIVQGEDVFPGQGFKLDTLLLDQVFTLSSEVVNRVFIPLAELYEDIEIFCIPGNHGKQGRPYQASRNTNWDYVAYWLWKERMANTKHVKFRISSSPFLIYEMYQNGQKHALIHGQQARGWLGYPYYGIDRLQKRLSSLVGIYLDYLHHGHHHQPSLQDTHVGKKIGNGSIEGGSDYSVNDLITANAPQQFFFGINEKGLTWEYWLRLAEYPKLQPDENGIYTKLIFE